MSSKLQESTLLAAARAGDRGAVAALLERHQGAVYGFGMRMCRNQADAQDVLQETLLTAAQKIDTFRGEASFLSWLYAIARSRCSQRRRSVRSTQQLDDMELPDSGPTPDETANRQRIKTILERALASLDPSYREVLLLRDVEGLTGPEAAEALGLSVPALKTRLHRARSMLRGRIEGLVSSNPGAPPVARCPDVVSGLSQRLEQELTAAQCAELETRLAGCADPSGRFDPLRRLLGQCRVCDQVRVPEGIQQSLRRALQEVLEPKG